MFKVIHKDKEISLFFKIKKDAEYTIPVAINTENIGTIEYGKNKLDTVVNVTSKNGFSRMVFEYDTFEEVVNYFNNRNIPTLLDKPA